MAGKNNLMITNTASIPRRILYLFFMNLFFTFLDSPFLGYPDAESSGF
jgi:hypothetical protein